MRVCDITRSESVEKAYTIVSHDPGVDMSFLTSNGDSPASIKLVGTYEVGRSAGAAFDKADWSALNRLTPLKLRAKDPKRAATAQTAAATRKANKEARAAAAAAEAQQQALAIAESSDASDGQVDPLAGV